jgi:NADPH-dependent glutamate synthase beta subunit-like oxidoreductase/NAD(P)H-flavin reductase
VKETAPGSALVLGVAGYRYEDLYEPAKLEELHRAFERAFAEESPADFERFRAYRASRGAVSGRERSDVLLAVAPHVGRFVARLFGVEADVDAFRDKVRASEPLWRFRRDFAKACRPGAESVARWTRGPAVAEAVARAALDAVGTGPVSGALDEELAVASATVALLEVDDVARKAAKAGGAEWTDALAARARRVHSAIAAWATDLEDSVGEAALGASVALALDAVAAWLAARRSDERDAVGRWASFHAARPLDVRELVPMVRPDPSFPELFVGLEHTRRQRMGFSPEVRPGACRDAEVQIDTCLLCHDREKDSCSHGLIDAKTKLAKRNALGVVLSGCPLGEKISEMHAMRKAGELLAAMAIVVVDNPMCTGTGHRICNDCMKACVFQKQEPVDIPQVETRVLEETLSLPWGLEIYQFLLRWNPLHVARPTLRPYAGRNVLIVGLGPAGYTLAHNLACEGFGVVAIDGLKIEPLDASLVGNREQAPVPVRSIASLGGDESERTLLGFGGVSEYGITARWDKRFLTVSYLTLARNRNVRICGGVRFGGTLTLDDAWAFGFDHVALCAGAGRPTVIEMKNGLARGVRQASDFLMALQLTGAYKFSSIANLQVSLPALVIGGGLTAVDTATELLAYYQVQVEKELRRVETLLDAGRSEADVRAMFDAEEWATLEEHMAHARALREEKALAAAEGRAPGIQRLLDRWGGVTVVYRKALTASPAYRLNHEEIAKSLEEGVRYAEKLTPVEALVDERENVRAMRFRRVDGSLMDLPARTVCVAAGTRPNVIYEREHPGTFELDDEGRHFRAHVARVDEHGRVALERAAHPGEGFFTSYVKDGRTVSFYGDNHPGYFGSVVRAMASAKDGYPHVVALFPDVAQVDRAAQAGRDARLASLFAAIDAELSASVEEVNRLTSTIVEVVVKAPMAAKKFQPGQFYRLQNFETIAPRISVTQDGESWKSGQDNSEARLAMEGLALTGAWVDSERGLLGAIVLETGGSSRLCAALRPGEAVVLMGPTGRATEIAGGETVLLCGGGLGNAVLFSIARAFKGMGSRVLYFAGYRRGDDMFKREEIERWTDQVVYCTEAGEPIEPRRPKDKHFRGNIVQAMCAYALGEIDGPPSIPLSEVSRIIAIGSDGMMNAVRRARHGVLAPLLDANHTAIGSINSPMQCMMKEVCAQCLQKVRDPATGLEHVVFVCTNQDLPLDAVDFDSLRERLRANSMQEKLASAWLDEILKNAPDVIRV